MSVAKTGNRVFFTNVQSSIGNGVSFAALTPGSGDGDLVPDSAGKVAHGGVAIDAAAGRVYWADSDGNKILFANLDGSGGASQQSATHTVTR